MFNENDIERIKKSSIGVDKKDKYVKVIKGIKKSLFIALMGIIICTSLISCSELDKDIYFNDNIDIYEVDRYFALNNQETYDLFLEYGITRQRASEGKVSVDEYRQIEELTEEDLIIYYDIFNRNECEKILQVLGYEGWDDFLIKNNYTDKNNKPSFENWLVSEYETITNNSKEGKTK